MIVMNKEILEITKKFHDTYEKLASEYTYETREDTKVFDINSNNGKLMYATVNEIVSPILKENKILRENAENNDKVVDKVNWKNQLLKKNNIQLKERIEYLERSNNRREDTILEQRQEISDLEDNWNKLKEYLINDLNDRNGHRVAEYEDSNKVSETISPIYTLMEDKSRTMKEVLDKMQELEQESGSDE